MSTKKTKSNNSKYTVIYLRYILPIIFSLASIGTMLITCLSYSKQEAVSSLDLMQNIWEQVRYYLFSGAKVDPEQQRYAWIMLSWLILSLLLYVIGLAATVAIAAAVLRFIKSRDESDSVRLWLVTLVPNRIVVMVLQALTLPVLFLSRIVIPLYGMINVNVTLSTTFIEPWIFGLIFFAVTAVLSVISARFEKQLAADAFKKSIVDKLTNNPQEARIEEDEDDDGDYTPMFSHLTQREEADKIKELLNKKPEDNE